MSRTHPFGTGRRDTVTRLLLGAVGAIACVVFAVVSPYFLSVDNLVNVLNDLAFVGILALPALFLLMTGHVDLTIGATAALSGILLASAAPNLGIAAGVILAVTVGAVIGAVNGCLVTVVDINSIAATFATMSLLRGLAYLIPTGLAIYLPGFRVLGNARPVLGLSIPLLIFLFLLLVGGSLSRAGAGLRCRAIGELPSSTRLDAARERRWVIALFVVSGLGAALAGLIRASQLGTGLPTAAIGTEITVLTAVLLGGGRLVGGRGSVAGTLLALLVISVVDNGLSLTNVTAYAEQVFHTLLLIIAITITIERPFRRRRRIPAPPRRGEMPSDHDVPTPETSPLAR